MFATHLRAVHSRRHHGIAQERVGLHGAGLIITAGKSRNREHYPDMSG
jgi:hypothetical protein